MDKSRTRDGEEKKAEAKRRSAASSQRRLSFRTIPAHPKLKNDEFRSESEERKPRKQKERREEDGNRRLTRGR
jgi:hypothetical protein